MITLIPIEQVSDAHGSLIVDAFNRFFILNGGEKDGYGHCNGVGYGYGTGDGTGYGDGDGGGYGDGDGNGNGIIPEEWQVK